MKVGMTLEDVAIYFSLDEWHLLNEAQRCLYLDVMLENFELVSSLGYCCGAEDVEAPFEQMFLGISQTKNPKVTLSSWKPHPCESCEPVLRHIFHLIEQQEKQHSQKLLRHGACAKWFDFSAKCHQHQEQYLTEKTFKRGVDRISLAKGCNFNVSQTLFACGNVGQDIPTSSVHLQQQTTDIRDWPNEMLTSWVTFQWRKNYYTWKNVRKLSAEATHLFQTNLFVVEDSVFCA